MGRHPVHLCRRANAHIGPAYPRSTQNATLDAILSRQPAPSILLERYRCDGCADAHAGRHTVSGVQRVVPPDRPLLDRKKRLNDKQCDQQLASRVTGTM